MFALEQVSIDRRGKRVLHAADLRFGAGELLAVVGPNGAGKSTLLKTLAGDLSPAAGQATLDGLPLADWDLEAMARRRAVYTQGDTLSFPFTVSEVVMLGRMPQRRRPLATDRDIVHEALRVTDTVPFAGRRYTELSGGERARVRLARALAQVWPDTPAEAGEPQRYLLLDEPLAALDLRYKYHMLEMLKARIGPGLGVLAVMHDLGLAARYADRVVLVDEGRLVADGLPEQVLTSERLSRHYRLPMQVLRLPGFDYPIITAGRSPHAAPAH